MNLDDRPPSILRRNYSGLDNRRPSSAKKSKGESKTGRRVPLLRLLFLSTGFDPPEGAMVDHHLLSGGAILSRVNDVIMALPSAPHPSLPVGDPFLQGLGLFP